MKTTNTEVKTETQTAPKVTLTDIVNKAKEKNPEGGRIEIQEIEKILKLERMDAVALCKSQNEPFFSYKPGRKGQNSALLFGKESHRFIEERNGRKNHTPAKKSKQVVHEAIQESFSSPMLRIKIGKDTYHDLPIELSLVGA